MKQWVAPSLGLFCTLIVMRNIVSRYVEQTLWACAVVSFFIRLHVHLTEAQQKINFKTDHKNSRRYATKLSQCVTLWSVSCSKTECSWTRIGLMQTIIILIISMTFKTFSHRENIGYQSLDLRSITKSYLIMQGVWRQLFTFLHFMFLIFHWNFHSTEYQLTAVLTLKNPELNPICYLLALSGAYPFLHVSRIRVKLLTFRLLMSYIYIYIYIWSTHSWCF